MKPLLFMPSPRNIPEVYASWEELPYDRYVVKNKLEREAYQNGRDFFLSHDEYTHLVICPDDIILDYDAFELLKRSVEEGNYNNLCGVGMVDETSNAYCCKPLGVPLDAKSGGSYFYKETYRHYKLLPDEITQVVYTGFMVQWLDRDLVYNISFGGGCEDGEGCMDLLMAKELRYMGIPYLIEPKAYFTHLRNRGSKELKEWKRNGDHKGYEIYVEKQG